MIGRASIAITVAFGFAAVFAAGPARAEIGPAPCEFDAYVIDPDPKGVNLRAAPSARAAVVATLPKSKEDTQVTLAAGQDGWFRAVRAFDFDTNKERAARGWIHGSRLGLSLRLMDSGPARETLRAEPAESAPPTVVLHWTKPEGRDEFDLSAEVPGRPGRERIAYVGTGAATAVPLACRGAWLKVKVHRYEGWVPRARLCGNPVTTCS
jgi:SH3-like domain-containing protein